MLAPDDLRAIAEELRCNAEALHDGHTLRGEWHDDDAKRKHDKLLAWADALVAVHAGPIKTHETIDWSRLAAEISADYPAVVRERDALRTKLREADSLHNRLADILHRSVANLRGEPPELVRWGCDDLPERVAMMRNVLRRADNYIRNRREPGDRVLRAIDRILGEAAPELGIDIDSLQCLADIRAAVGDSGQMTQPELVECIKRLRAALATAREWIAAERQSQAECVTLPDGSIDACERAALADIDAVLSEIDAAMAKEA